MADKVVMSWSHTVGASPNAVTVRHTGSTCVEVVAIGSGTANPPCLSHEEWDALVDEVRRSRRSREGYPPWIFILFAVSVITTLVVSILWRQS